MERGEGGRGEGGVIVNISKGMEDYPYLSTLILCRTDANAQKHECYNDAIELRWV